MKTFLLIATCVFAMFLDAKGGSSRAEIDSGKTAHGEMERSMKLSYQGVFDAYKCEFFFYTNLQDADNFGGLKDADRKELLPTLGKASFFLHRFTSKAGKEEVREIYVSKDGKTILLQRGRKAP